MKRLLLIISVLCFLFSGVAQSTAALEQHIIPTYNTKAYDTEINKLYQTLPEIQQQPIAARIATISQYFLGKPYLLGALGEGPEGQYDQGPVYRSDAFDCVTYVSTVLALAETKNLQQFQQVIKDINYSDGKTIFTHRNHFMEVDWNHHNARKGFIRDITNSIVDENGKPVALVAKTVIHKPNWYKAFKAEELKLLKRLGPQEIAKRLDELHAEGEQLPMHDAATPYLPLTRLFNAQGEPNERLFAQIPSGSIIEIVRPNWQLWKLIGTNMNISHLGLAIRTPQGLMYREASSVEHKVIDIPLTSYLKKYLSSSTIKGINVQLILEKIK